MITDKPRLGGCLPVSCRSESSYALTNFRFDMTSQVTWPRSAYSDVSHQCQSVTDDDHGDTPLYSETGPAQVRTPSNYTPLRRISSV